MSSTFDEEVEAEVDRRLDQHIRSAFASANPSVHWVRAERAKWRSIYRRNVINERLFYGRSSGQA